MITTPRTDAGRREAMVQMLDDLPPWAPFTAQEAERQGVDAHARRRLVAEGLLAHPVRRVYHRADRPDDLALRVEVLSLVVPADCVVTDRTAAYLWGAPMALAPGDHLVVPPISVFAPPGRRLRNGLTASGERRLGPCDVVKLGGLRVTVPLRTACDAARLLHRDQAIGVIDQLAAVGNFTAERMGLELERFKGFRGVVQARVLAPLLDAGSQSPSESTLRLRWHDARLPWPECQIEVPGPDGNYYLDMGTRRRKLAAEFDGAAHHRPEDERHDHQRRTWVREVEGWTVLVFRAPNVYGRDQDADRVLRDTWQALNADPSLT